jgi:hypothetical protein
MWDKQAQSKEDEEAEKLEKAELLMEHEQVINARRERRKSVGKASPRPLHIN